MVTKREGDSESRVARDSLPEDRFDRLPKQGRVGAHRIVARPRRFWIYAISAIVGIALLTTAGIIAVQSTGSGIGNWIGDSGQTPVAPDETTPKLDPEAAVVVLNGTTTSGFAGIVDQLITENGWGTILFSGDAASDAVTISAVFYSSVADEAAALGLARELGGVSVYQSYDYSAYGAKLIVLLGADYAGPGSEQLTGDPPADTGADESEEGASN